MLVAFVINGFNVRGTEAVTWAFAHYNETMLNNTSVIVLRQDVAATSEGCPDVTQEAMDRFTTRFPVVSVEDADMDRALTELRVDVCVISCYGVPTCVPKSVATVTHCVFRADVDLGSTVRTAVSRWVARGLVDVLPNMVVVEPSDGTDLRESLGIPKDAFVFGRYGGWDTFDVQEAHDAVSAVAASRPDVHFVFMHTRPFVDLPNVHHVEATCDLREKRRFVDTCDAMIHARAMGETFGCAPGEFAVCGKPVVTLGTGDLAHVDILGPKAIVAGSRDELERVLRDVDALRAWDMSGNGYHDYVPEKVAPILRSVLVNAFTRFHS